MRRRDVAGRLEIAQGGASSTRPESGGHSGSDGHRTSEPVPPGKRRISEPHGGYVDALRRGVGKAARDRAG